MDGLLPLPVDNFEKASKASGKLGGVAGVLHGVIIWKYKMVFVEAFLLHETPKKN